MRKILAYISDTHAGHEHGLCNPATPLRKKDDQGNWYITNPVINTIQKYLYWLIENGVAFIERLADGDPIDLFHGGDPTHGNYYIDAVFEKHPSNQLRIALYNMMPFLKLPNLKHIRYVTGTPVHEFGDSSATDLLTEWTKHIRPEVDINFVDHGLVDIDGFVVDYTHHAPTAGKRTHLIGNQGRYDLTSVMQLELQEGHKPANLYLRGHTHEYVEERRRLGKYVSWYIVAPAMCMPDAYTRKVTQGGAFIVRNGITAFEIVDGDLVKVYPLHSVRDQRTKERWE